MITASYSPTGRDRYDATFFQQRLRFNGILSRVIGCMILLAWISSFFQPHDFGAMFILSLFAGLMLAFGDRIMGLIWSIMGRKYTAGKTFDFAFTLEHYRLTYPGAEFTVAWPNVLEVISTRKGYLICPNKFSGLWLPLHAFHEPSGPADFLKLLNQAGVKTRKL
ncbi:hypothetical protein BH09VER1_BH09VER1_48870 [soil metagenome]